MLGLYVHVPFCAQKCNYCDFNSYKIEEKNQKKDYLISIKKEMELYKEEFKNKEFTSVFLGGGTPSILTPEELTILMENIYSNFNIKRDAEITMECNPGTLNKVKLKAIKSLGINRLSMGLQVTQDHHLKYIGRIHTYEQFEKNYKDAIEVGIDNINVDLMYSLPNQSFDEWKETLNKIINLNPSHISAYSLILEEGTKFYDMYLNKEFELNDEEVDISIYNYTIDTLYKNGYHQYEISNYAKNGYECRHNIGYWKRTEYLGLGLGAASLVDEELWKCLCGEETSGSSEREGMDGTEYCSLEQREYRFCNTRNLQEYLENSRKPRIIRRDVAALSEKEQQEEFMFLGLRMTKGISVQEFRGRFGKEIEEIYGQVLKKYEAMGFLEESGGFWRFTRKGIHVSNHILSDFLQD